MALYLASTTEWCQSAATADISSPGHPNAAGCVQMCASINHWQDRRKRWWTGNTRLDKQNNEFQQPGPATHTLWPLFKHVLIMSPCLQLCKHILTLSSTLCCDWNLAQSQCWWKKKREKREAPVLQQEMEQPRCWRGSQKKMDAKSGTTQALFAWAGEERDQKSVNWRTKNRLLPVWGGRKGGGLGGQDFLVCYNSQSVYKWNADRKFYSSLTV